MWHYVFLLLRRQPGKSALASSGFLLAACALILLSATTQTTVLRADQAINQNWRPAYDLVVLPPQAKIPAGAVVPADFLQSYVGGISIQQYQQIKHLAGIEVAAPIAYIGSASLPTPFIEFPQLHISPGFYQLNWTVTAFNGQKRLVEDQKSDIFYLYPCGDVYATMPPEDVLDILANPHSCAPSPGDHPVLTLRSPDTGSFLLAAIDPEAENQLVHLDQSVASGRMLLPQEGIQLDKYGNHVVPILLRQHLPGQITLTTHVIQLSSGPPSADQIQKLQDPAYVSQLPTRRTIFEGPVPLVQNDPQRFANAHLTWDGQTWQTLPNKNFDETFSGSILNLDDAFVPAGLTYQPATAPNGEAGYTLVPTGRQGPEATFRDFALVQPPPDPPSRHLLHLPGRGSVH